ncbi:hypothetical protein, partial [Xanthomonas euvesicatoria]
MKSLEQGRKASCHLTSGGKEIPHQRKAQRKQVAVGKSIDAQHRVAATRTPRTKRGHQPTGDQRREGSTPISRTVVKELQPSDPAWPPFAASLGCGVARCSQT